MITSANTKCRCKRREQGGPVKHTNSNRRRPETTLKEAKDDELRETAAHGAGDREDDKTDIADVVHDDAPVQLGYRGQEQGPDGEAENVDRDDKIGEQLVVIAEFVLQLWDARRKHGRGERRDEGEEADYGNVADLE